MLQNKYKFLFFSCLLSLAFYAQTETESKESASSSWVNPEHTGEDFLTDFKAGWFVGADIGKTVFYGDVALYNIFPRPSEFKESMGNCGSFYFGKKLKWGLSVEFQGFKGSLTGNKLSGRLYERHFDAEYYQYSGNVKYNLSQLAFRDAPGRKVFNRFTVYLTAGGGQFFYRSRMYKLANNNYWYLESTKGYQNAGIDSVSSISGAGIVTTKEKMKRALALPGGVKINFKLNGQTDICLDATYTTIFSDDVDCWSRVWTAQDRYLHLGIGLVYQIGADGDVPEDQRLFRPKSKSKATDDAYDKGESKPERKGLFNFGGKSKGNKKDDRDLEIRMKMYELQLKLFEMQYLMNQ